MPGDRFEFDESGDTFFCFLVAFYTLVLIPVTYCCWPSLESKDNYEQGKRKCMCQPCQVKRHNLKASTPWKKLKKFLVKGGFALAWCIFFVMIYKLTLVENVESGFDPFIQLEISKDASASEIRRAYKRLSVMYHPDRGGDPKRFILISKAYAALTNEESRKNWEEYGNPDGPGAAHFGIALPKWMIQKENFYLVIGAYVLLFMLLLPIAVGVWWYNTMKFSNNNVLLDTIRYFCSTSMRSPYMAMPRVIKVLSNAYEFNPTFNKQIVCRPSDNVELPPLIMQIPIFTIFKKAIVGSPSSVKARALIYAHLDRLDLPAKTLYLDKQYIIKNCPRLLDEMINSLLYVLAVAMDEAGSRQKTPQHLATIENCIHLIPMLIQALSDSACPLMQLPHIGPSQLRYMMSKQRNIKSVRQLGRLPDDKRRSLLRSLSDEQYRDVLNVCASMPLLEITYNCEVLDDDDPSIWPLSMVTATVTLKRHALFEPCVSGIGTTMNSGTGSALLSEMHYSSGGGSGGAGGGRLDWSPYSSNQHVPADSQLYAAADMNLDTSVMTYGDFGVEEDPDPYTASSNKPKKTTAPVWDKNRRKKPVRKNKQRKQEQWKQQQQQQQENRPDVSSMGKRPVNDGSETITPRNRQPDSDVEADDMTYFDSSQITKCTGNAESGDEGSVEKSKIPALPDEEHDEVDMIDGDVTTESGDYNKLPRSSFKSSERVKSFESKPHCTHMVHCPYFPVEKFEGWWVYMVDRKSRQLITKPLYIATLQTEEQIPLRFVAPSTPGSYLYTLCVRSDSYVDCDFFETIRFTVSPLPERIVRYLKEQEEAHTDSSGSEDDSSEDVESSESVHLSDQDIIKDDDDDDDVDDDAFHDERLSAYLAKA